MRGNPVVVKGFDGHYPQKRDGQIPENGFSSLENVLVTSQGTLKPRPGLSTIGSANFRVGDLKGWWTKSDGTRKLIVDEFIGGNLGVTQLTADGDTAVTILNGQACDLLLQWNDLAFIFSNGDIQTWNGAAATDTNIAVHATLGTVFKSRMFVCDNGVGTVDNSILRYSEIFDSDAPNTSGGWPSQNTINIASEDGDIITAVAILNDTLIVFKRFSTWAVYVEGLPPWTVRQLHPNIGCIGRDTAIVIGGLLYFRAANGVYRTDGTTFELLSAPIKEFLDDDPGMVYNECNARSAVWWGDYYLLNDYANGRTETWWECYNLENGAWSRLVFSDGIQKHRAIIDRETSPPTILVLEGDSSADTGNLQSFSELNDFEDNGAPFTCTIASKMYDFDKPSEWKMVRELDFELSLITPFDTFSASCDVVSERATTATQTKSIEGQHRSLLRFRGPMRCRAMRYTLEFEPVADSEINQVVFDILVAGRVGVGH